MTLDIKTLSHRLDTQDHHGTAQCYFVVFEKERIYGMSYEYSDSYGWYLAEGTDSGYIDGDEEFKAIESLADGDDEININGDLYNKVYYKDNDFSFLQAFLTEKSALDWVEANKHNHPTAYVYGWSAHNNPEIKGLRKHFMSEEAYNNGK